MATPEVMTMAKHWLRLRQICLVARELKPHLEDLREVLGIEVCHVDPGVGTFGLENSLMPIGSQFLEIVAPVRERLLRLMATPCV